MADKLFSIRNYFFLGSYQSCIGEALVRNLVSFDFLVYFNISEVLIEKRRGKAGEGCLFVQIVYCTRTSFYSIERGSY